MKINGYAPEKRQEKYPQLPVGAYVCAIQNIKVDGQEPDQSIVIRLEVIEGEWAGYYGKRYRHDSQNAGFNQNYQAKYKGDFRMQIPDERNAKRIHPEWDLRALNQNINCILESNPGMTWDGDTNNLAGFKGKMVGINVREAYFNGNPFTEIARLETVEDVRNGKCKELKPREEKKNGQQTTSAESVDSQTGFVGVEVDDLPF